MASSSSSRKRKYDVFLSYRGDDTRLNILSHIRRCLDNQNIVSFKDDEMKRGEEIWPSLKDGIESSTIVLVIFSKRFANSRWCLDELLHILESKEKHDQKVFPIFFHVDPSHVRKPTTGVFADDFAKHKENFDNLVVEKWISAMAKFGNFSGFALENGSEVDLLDKVIEVILQNIEPLPSVQANKLVGIGSHVRKLESLMRHTHCFLGIAGMGGIGKTTIAGVIFDIFRGNFDGAIFLSVAEFLRGSDMRNIDLTKTFLSGLMEKEVIVSSPFVRHYPHARWLLNKKLLVVLDDVKSEQFENLIGDLCRQGENGRHQHVFGLGTKIIVISRDKQLLRDICRNGDESIYEVEGLKYWDARQLFCRHPFGQNYSKEEFKHLLEPFLKYAEGNPLALKVLGSLLRGKTKEEWESLLKILDKNQDLEIYKKLKISYDLLDENQKTIFRYIACYFHYVSSTTIDMLDSGGLGTTYGIGVLEDKCLLERDNRGLLRMHNLLREMGKQIVKQESNDPTKRSILWEPSDVRRVFSKTTESEAVEGIKLVVSNKEEQIVLKPNDFMKLPHLKFLKIDWDYWSSKSFDVQCPDGLDYLPHELRLLDWNGCPLKRLPDKFQPANLFELNLWNNELEELWDGRKDLTNLQRIGLSNSRRLTKVPDLSSAPNLKWINLSYCSSLVDISSSIKHLHKLQNLDISYCQNIRSLPCWIWKLKSLEILNVSNCSKLETLSERTEFPEPSTSQLDIYGQLSPLKVLCINGCGKLRVLPKLSLTTLLHHIDASDCESLETSLFDLKQLFWSQRAIEYLDDYHGSNIYKFINCWKLDVRWVEIAALAKKRIQAMSVLYYFKTQYDHRDPFEYCNHFFMGYPGCEIPKWITHQNRGVSITLQIPVTERLLGFAISVVVPSWEHFERRDISIRFNFKNRSGYSYVWRPIVTYYLRYDIVSSGKLENTIIYGIPLSINHHSQMIDRLGSDGDYYEVTLYISHLEEPVNINIPENFKCGMIPLFLQNANRKQPETPIDETTEVIITENNGNLEVFVDDYRVKNPDQKTLSKMYKEVTTDNPEGYPEGILYCIWGNENCRKPNYDETFSWLNEGEDFHSAGEDFDGEDFHSAGEDFDGEDFDSNVR